MEYSREFVLLKNMVRGILGRWFGGWNSMDDEIDELTSYVARFVSKDTSVSNNEIIKEAIEVYKGNKFQNKHHGVTLDIINDIVKDRVDYDKLNLIEIKEFVDEYISNNKGGYNSSINFGEVVQRYFKQKAKTDTNIAYGNMVYEEMSKKPAEKMKMNPPVVNKEEVLCVCNAKDAAQLGAVCNITCEDSDRNALGLVLVTFEQIPGKNEFQLTTRKRFITVDRFKRGNWGDKPIYLKFSHAFELMKAGFKCSPLLHQEYEYCFGIKDTGYRSVGDNSIPMGEWTQVPVIMQFLSQKATGISSPISPTIDNFTMGMMLDDWKVV